MKLDGALSMRVRDGGEEAAGFEAMGLDGAWTFEAGHDPFIPLTLASQTTSRIELGTAIAVAFARTPMLSAHIAWDLQTITEGRFILGLGTQIRPHKPAERLRAHVHAVPAIWDCWSTGDKLNFRGDFYSRTLMPPFFNPGPLDVAAPPIYLVDVACLTIVAMGTDEASLADARLKARAQLATCSAWWPSVARPVGSAARSRPATPSPIAPR